MKHTYQSYYLRSIQDPVGFWGEAAQDLHWDRLWDNVLDDLNKPFYRWFTGGIINTCYNALDRHVENGRADQVALIYDSPLADTSKQYTYRALRDEVARFAGVLVHQGICKGDRVLIYMPMVPEAVIAMLGCARIGAVHTVVFGGFAANELANRINDANPRLIISASCGLEPGRIIEYKPLLDEALRIAKVCPGRCIILNRPQLTASMELGRDIDWDEAISAAVPVDCVPVKASDPLYILYTSGTTGMPKGVVRDNGGHAVALKWSMQNIYGVKSGEVFWAASDIGWVVGHSYIVYAPLLHGCTTILYEGKPVGTPDPGAFWRVVSEHKVNVLFTAPTSLRAIKREDPNGKYIHKYARDEFRTLFLAGERCDPDTLLWAEGLLKVPVIDHWWQTETGWPIAANCLGIEKFHVKPGSVTKPVPGYDVYVLNSDAREVRNGTLGNIVVKLPLPPGTLTTIWKNDAGYKQYYLDPYPGYYLTGDAGYKDDDGYLWVMSRIDDIINTAGHRLSTGAMEEVLASHPDVAECAVIGAADNLKGELPIGIVVLKSGVGRPHELIISEMVQLVRDKIGPVACFKQAIIVNRLPKTRSGKVLRGTMRKIADGHAYKIPPTIDEPDSLGKIADALKTIGYPQ